MEQQISLNSWLSTHAEDSEIVRLPYEMTYPRDEANTMYRRDAAQIQRGTTNPLNWLNPPQPGIHVRIVTGRPVAVTPAHLHMVHMVAGRPVALTPAHLRLLGPADDEFHPLAAYRT